MDTTGIWTDLFVGGTPGNILYSYHEPYLSFNDVEFGLTRILLVCV